MQDTTQLEDTYNNWITLSDEEKVETYLNLGRDDQDELFLRLSPPEQQLILEGASPAKTRTWLRSLDPDDLVDLLQLYPEEERQKYIDVLDKQTKAEVNGLLAYRDDVAGGLMNTRYARLRPNMSAEEALKYLRAKHRDDLLRLHSFTRSAIDRGGFSSSAFHCSS